MLDRVDEAIARARVHLLGLQSPQGYWAGELESDVTVTAGYIPLLHFLGLRNPVRERKAAYHVRRHQLPDGSWSLYPGGPGDLNVSLQAYFALKLAGVPESELEPARDFILAQGGIHRAHTFTKILLALFGQYPWGRIPCLPPELVLLPNWSYFNIYDFASWSRATIVALMIVMAHKPLVPVPESAALRELYPSADNHRGPQRHLGV